MNTKTIVFAALIAAMILPFGGMQSVSAYPGEYNLPESDIADGRDATNLTIEQLEDLLWTAETRLVHFEAKLITAEARYANGDLSAASDISSSLDAIDRFQSTIDWAQAEIDSRAA